ncbi:MAG TPA: DMT family transporter, partial [Coleofasciculaceae cyanobacterium]
LGRERSPLSQDVRSVVPAVAPARSTLVWVLLAGMVAISTGAIFARWAMQSAGRSDLGFGLWLAAGRVSLAAIAVAPAWRGVVRSPRRAWPWAIGAGACLALHFVCWLTSLGYTSIAASTVLVTTTPVWVAIATGWLARRFVGWPTVAGLAIALVGSGLIAFGQGDRAIGSAPLLGNALALAGAWAAGGYLLLGRAAQARGLTIGAYAAIAYGSAAVLLGPLAGGWGGGWQTITPETLLAIALSALVPQLVGHTSFNWLVARVSPVLVTLAILFEPVGASSLGWLVFGERPGPIVLLGGAIVLVGVAVAVLAADRPAQDSY